MNAINFKFLKQMANAKTLIILLLSIVTLFFFACSKEDISIDENQNLFSEKVNGFFKYQLDKDLLVINEEDQEDEAINWKLIEISEKLKPALLNSSVRNQIISLAKENEKEFVSLGKLIENIPEIRDLFKEVNSFNGDSFSMTHQGTDYEAVINIPNIKIADFSLEPFISPGIEIEDNDDLGIRDNIFAWMLTDNIVFEEVVISEKRAMATKNPLFVVGPHPIEDADNIQNINDLPPVQQTQESSTAELRDPVAFHMNEYRINHRYEASGRSEFAMTAARIDPGGAVTGLVLRKSNGNYVSELKLHEVKKKNIGKNLSGWKHISIDYSPRNDYFIFFNTYERDWYHSSKNLGGGTAYGTTVYLSGKRKYTSEYYAFSPYYTNNQRMDLAVIYNTWLQVTSNSKGHINIWRVGI